MKYNKSEIMKRAWVLFRMMNSSYTKSFLNYTFSDALKSAWKETKKVFDKAEKIADAMSKRIVEFAKSECFVNITTGVIGGRSTYQNRAIFKKCGFRWQYVGGTAYEYNKDGFAWVGSDNAIKSLLENVL